MRQRFVSMVRRLGSARQGIDLRRSNPFEERNGNLRVDRRRPQTLAHRNAVMLMQVIANVLAAALVAHDHFVAALAAPGDPVQQCRAATRDAATLGAQIFGAVVAQHGPDLLKCLPTYVSGIFVLHHDPPVHSRTPRLDRPNSRKVRQLLARPTANKSTNIGRILQHGGDGRNGRTPPAYLAMTIPARECDAARSKSPHHFGRGPGVQKALEEQCDAFLHLTIWILGDDTGRIADEATLKW